MRITTTKLNKGVLLKLNIMLCSNYNQLLLLKPNIAMYSNYYDSEISLSLSATAELNVL